MATSCQLGTAWVPSYVEGPSSADRTLDKAHASAETVCHQVQKMNLKLRPDER